MGVMTERKLMGIVGDLFPKGMDSDYQAGFNAGFHDLTPNPCPTKNVRCAEGVVAGKSLREFFLCLSGETDDDLVASSVAELLCLDPKVVEKTSRFASLVSYQKSQLSSERAQEERSSDGLPSRFVRLLRLEEEAGFGGCVSFS